ncbi:MAG TPA: hypothetical protein P5555_11520 [Candidatus Paceibacterota bacterium]|nr:hypothetical protein [Verrucomicrobiota bacterium]HRZ45809.1 hypothetical protein [Candidatus Paceibacterota bacterium]
MNTNCMESRFSWWIHALCIALFGAAGCIAARGAQPVGLRLSLDGAIPDADVLSWPDSPEPYYLEEISSLRSPAIWMPVMAAEEIVGGIRRITLPKETGMRFFQLRLDPDPDLLMLDYAVSLASDLPLKSVPGDQCPDVPFLDRFNPAHWSPLIAAPRTLEGGFVLAPGLWEVELESYCLKTGTPTPREGDGYVAEVMNGPRADIVTKVIRGATLDPSIDQESAQVLLWAIILRTPLSGLPDPLQSLAAELLSPDDLERLDAAAELKGRQKVAYTRRFMRAWGAPYENLPLEVRESLGWDEEAEQGLAESMELSYEDIQALAFAAAPPSGPTEPPRFIPYGRWSWMPEDGEPPGGFMIRYLVGGYTETLVQVCVPETISVETDAWGRITRIADLEGAEIRTTYDDGVPPLEVGGESGLKGYAFGQIAIVGPRDEGDPRRLLTASHSGIGWTLAGTFQGGGTTENQGRFADATHRYAWALLEKAELDRLDAELTRVHPGRPPGPASSAARLMNLANYCEALRLALAAAILEEDPAYPHLADRLGLAYRAWIAEFATFCRGQAAAGASGAASGSIIGRPTVAAAGAPPKPDILDRTVFRLMDFIFSTRQYAAQPANSSSQNIGLSGRVTQAVQNWWNAHFGGYKRNNTIVSTTFKVAKMPSFLAIPQKVIEKLIDINMQLYKYAGETIRDAGGDPPRPFRPMPAAAGGTLARADYDVPTIEQVWAPGPLEAGAGISAQRLAAAQLLQDRMLQLAAHLHAAVVAIQRQEGAYRAGNEYWYLRQGAYAVHHERRAGACMWDTADAIESWVSLLDQEGVEEIWVNPQEYQEVIDRLRTEGYTAEERSIFQNLGLNDNEIAACLDRAREAELETDDVGVLSGLNAAATTLREAGSVLMQLPVSFGLRSD